ncbi:hypothetical protein K2173_005084 [Erythroxylum novogranatense]|uniref:Cation-transporting ATPase n=1 Tax=Erythroxylum novogranatense TaxID=1862640 RepID=A0AAV8TBH2_9ROSI|nr:hypothetical protein K2173_005084 [Erythroxylum novogranatense]
MMEDPNSGISIFGSKLIGDKRHGGELKDQHQLTNKRMKMRDLDPSMSSQATNFQPAELEEPSARFQFDGEASQVTDLPVTLDVDASQAERSQKATLSLEVSHTLNPRDHNSDACSTGTLATNFSSEHAEIFEKASILKKHACQEENKRGALRSIGLDLNAEDCTSSLNQSVLNPIKNDDQLRDPVECGSTTGPVEEKDSMRVWKEMKQNGFLSSSQGGISFNSCFMAPSHGGIPVPKQRGRKSKNDVVKKRMELAKREQVDRFTKIAAPSGLLNGLNPGIINHVRNKKQVHSIIEALVRSEKHSKNCAESLPTNQSSGETKETSNMTDFGTKRQSFSNGNLGSKILSRNNQMGGCAIIGEGGSSMVDKICSRNFVSHSTTVGEDDSLVLRLSSSTKASDESSTVSNEESTIATNVSTLSVKAASVASQWLELLHQDIKGRLSALRRSKRRLRAVIITELPFLITKEFSSNQQHGFIIKNNCVGLSSDANTSMHQERWSSLFNEMDKALTEEEKQLESWLSQVKEMQLQCDHGLQYFQGNAILGFQQQGRTELCAGLGNADSSERELAVRAAAASIYSTCNFLTSKGDVSCF